MNKKIITLVHMWGVGDGVMAYGLLKQIKFDRIYVYQKSSYNTLSKEYPSKVVHIPYRLPILLLILGRCMVGLKCGLIHPLDVNNKTGKYLLKLLTIFNVIVPRSSKSLHRVDCLFDAYGEIRTPINSQRELIGNVLDNNQGKCFAIHLGGGGNSPKSFFKRIPSRTVKSIINKIESTNGRVVLFYGPGEESTSSERGVIAWSIDLEKKLVNSEFIYIGPDCGLAHYIAWYGGDVIELFGPTDPTLIGAQNATWVQGNIECSPCYNSRNFDKCKNARCMSTII